MSLSQEDHNLNAYQRCVNSGVKKKKRKRPKPAEGESEMVRDYQEGTEPARGDNLRPEKNRVFQGTARRRRRGQEGAAKHRGSVTPAIVLEAQSTPPASGSRPRVKEL